MNSLSVIVPIFNVEEYLPQCLDSLFKQDAPGAIEVILIDDGSSDSSPTICDDYLRRFTNVSVIHQENKGLSEARNAGISVASGDWIFFLDADDWLAPMALNTLLGFAETQSCDMVVGSFYYAYPSYLLYDNRWFKNQTPFIMTREEAMRELILQHFFKNFAWGKLYRTAIVKEHLFRPHVFFEDVYWQHLIVHDAQRIGVITQPLYYYRQRANSISGTFSARNLDLLKGNEERFRFIMDRYPALTELAAKAFWSLCFQQKEFADGKFPEIKAFYDRIEKEYGSLFSTAVRLNPFYFASHHCPAIIKVLQQCQRVFAHCFAKRPKMIPLRAQG